MRGIIDRRILVNYHVDPEVLAKILPSPFRPQLIHGKAIAGICLIRLKQVRPRGLPGCLGISSENAAHRIAVEWDDDGKRQTGVYIPRRDTSSRLNTLLGGRLFPGFHHAARYQVNETDDRYSVSLDSHDDNTHVSIEGRVTTEFPESSVFHSLQDASDFFKGGALGYSATRTAGSFDGLELRTSNWNVQPLQVDRVESSFFQDSQLFPAGSVAFDCALLMRNIEHEWHAVDRLHKDQYKHATASRG